MRETQKLRLLYQSITRERVVQLIGIDELDYSNHQVDTGISYLMKICDCTEVEAIEIGEQTLFWGWWSNQWYRLDRTFLKKYARSKFSQDWLSKRYKELHDPDFLDVFPHSVIMRLNINA